MVKPESLDDRGGSLGYLCADGRKSDYQPRLDGSDIRRGMPSVGGVLDISGHRIQPTPVVAALTQSVQFRHGRVIIGVHRPGFHLKPERYNPKNYSKDS